MLAHQLLHDLIFLVDADLKLKIVHKHGQFLVSFVIVIVEERYVSCFDSFYTISLESFTEKLYSVTSEGSLSRYRCKTLSSKSALVTLREHFQLIAACILIPLEL